jgi:hypothetical protein
MDFQISALPLEPFAPLFGRSDDELARAGVVRMTVTEHPAAPCRVSLRDAAIGETVLLLNYEHQPADSPYRSRHAIFVREGAETAHLAVNEVPEVLRRRLIGARAFDDAGMMTDADVADGQDVDSLIRRLLARDDTAYVQLHYAKRGCYAARAERA